MDQGLLEGGCVVVPPGAPLLEQMARDAGFTPVPNPDAPAGLGTSIRVGFDWLGRSAAPGPAAAVLFLGDQPSVPPVAAARVIAAWESGDAAAARARYAEAPDEPGHPIVVDRSLWPRASELTGDTGLGPLLAAGGVPVLDVPIPGRSPDVDTQADLTNLEGTTR